MIRIPERKWAFYAGEIIFRRPKNTRLCEKCELGKACYGFGDNGEKAIALIGPDPELAACPLVRRALKSELRKSKLREIKVIKARRKR